MGSSSMSTSISTASSSSSSSTPPPTLLRRERRQPPVLPEPEPKSMTIREKVSIMELAKIRRRLIMREHPRNEKAVRVDTHSGRGMEACSTFLRALEKTASDLRLQAASREYRATFSVNYKNLFRGETRHYRVDILEAGISLQQHPVVVANGEEYELSAHAMSNSEVLKEVWAEMLATLDEVPVRGAGAVAKPSARVDRTKVAQALTNLDTAWANFEQTYISELMHVQQRARGLVAQAVDAERRMAELEAQHQENVGDVAAYQLEKRHLVQCIAKLNSVANFQRKGRDDLTVAILDASCELLEGVCAEPRPASAPAEPAAARVLAEQVVLVFEEMRDYLSEVSNHLDLLHPHLCQNSGLVAQLVRWEEAWEIGARYVHNEDVLGALGYLVPQLRRARAAVPALAEMAEDCDAELFLVLPRLVLLCLLSDPARAIELIRRLLPHRFAMRRVQPRRLGGGLQRSSSSPSLAALAEAGRPELAPCLGEELQAVTEKFWRAELLLTHAAGQEGPSAWEVLVRRAVAGTGADGAQAFEALPPGEAKDRAVALVEDLMRELEGWSMELQRHSAEDWNECINVLMQCAASDGSDALEKARGGEFSI